MISLGSRRSHSAPEPSDDGILPADDLSWDSGDASRALHTSVSTPLSEPQPTFARMCQAAMLISRTAMITQSDSATEEQLHYAFEALSEEICGFTKMLEDKMTHETPSQMFENLRPCSIAWSALYLLLDRICCPEKLADEAGYVVTGSAKSPMQVRMQGRAAQLTVEISQKGAAMADFLGLKLSAASELDFTSDKLGPFCLDSLYCAMLSLHWLHREQGDASHRSDLKTLAKCFVVYGRRWNLGNTYLSLSERYDAFNSEIET